MIPAGVLHCCLYWLLIRGTWASEAAARCRIERLSKSSFSIFRRDLSQNAPKSHLVLEGQKPNPRARSPPPFSTPQPDSTRKEVNGLNPSKEKRVWQTFDLFCKRLLSNTAKELYRKQQRRKAHETPFSELSDGELAALCAEDSYGSVEEVFDVLGDAVVVKDGDIAEALKGLPPEKRDIVLLSYFIGMTDREIAERMDIMRRTVTNRRASSLRELKRIMEENGYERD
jgi:RNA polymerase sigma factor (sigma-70 family)